MIRCANRWRISNETARTPYHPFITLGGGQIDIGQTFARLGCKYPVFGLGDDAADGADNANAPDANASADTKPEKVEPAPTLTSPPIIDNPGDWPETPLAEPRHPNIKQRLNRSTIDVID